MSCIYPLMGYLTDKFGWRTVAASDPRLHLRGRNQQPLSRSLHRIFGFDPGPSPPSYAEPVQRMHPEDARHNTPVVEQAIRDRTDSANDSRLLLPNGAAKYVEPGMRSSLVARCSASARPFVCAVAVRSEFSAARPSSVACPSQTDICSRAPRIRTGSVAGFSA